MSRITTILRKLNPYMIKKGIGYLFKYGPKELYYKVADKSKPYDVDYMEYFRSNMPSVEELNRQKDEKFNYSPLISVIVPCYNTPTNYLREMIDSVIEQTYSNWELCIALFDDSVDKQVLSQVIEYANSDNRIKYTLLGENYGISGNTNKALELAMGDYISLMDHDDKYVCNLLYEAVKAINNNAEVIYTDEDKTNEEGEVYYEPYFKSDFNIHLLRNNNYICHAFIVKKSIVDEIGGFRSEFDGSQDYDFIFRCVEKSNKIHHIPKVLYHWRVHNNSTAKDPRTKSYAFDLGAKAIKEHLNRCNIPANVTGLEDRLGFYKVEYILEESPLVSIIIPNKDQRKVLRRCVSSILEYSSYSTYEIIIVENNSMDEKTFKEYEELKALDNRIKVVTWEKEFNYSSINNYGVGFAKGEYILFLNNDIKVITKNWLEDMLGCAVQENVGAVGAKLIYSNNTVQHGGVIVGLGGVAGHAFVGTSRNDNGYFCKALLKQNVSAVTAACMLVDREAFENVGGFNEDLAVAFNDIDLCLSIIESGYDIVYDANVMLYHYESISRGYETSKEKIARFNKEIEYMKEKWKIFLEKGDPYYNVNLALNDNGYNIKSIEK